MRTFRRAEEVYNGGNFLIAIKRFQSFIEKFPNSESVGKAKLYIAVCYKKAGELGNAIRTYISITEGRFSKENIVEAIKYLGKINSKKAKEYLEKKLSTPDIQIRAATAEALGMIGNNKTVKKMMKALEKERESNIQEKLLSSMANIGGKSIRVKSLISLFKRGSEDLKVNIVKFLSIIKKNHVIKFLQKQLETSSVKLKPYIIWALARIDPYLYGVRIEGTINKGNGSWWLVQEKSGKKHELIKPDANVCEEELKKFNDKKVILFGGKYQGRILYTDIYPR